MAQIVEEVIVIKLSRIVKDDEKHPPTMSTQDLLNTVESVVTELLEHGVIVEATVA